MYFWYIHDKRREYGDWEHKSECLADFLTLTTLSGDYKCLVILCIKKIIESQHSYVNLTSSLAVFPLYDGKNNFYVSVPKTLFNVVLEIKTTKWYQLIY